MKGSRGCGAQARGRHHTASRLNVTLGRHLAETDCESVRGEAADVERGEVAAAQGALHLRRCAQEDPRARGPRRGADAAPGVIHLRHVRDRRIPRH